MTKEEAIALTAQIDWQKVSKGQSEAVEMVNSLSLFITGRPLKRFCMKCISDAYYQIQEFIKDEKEIHS